LVELYGTSRLGEKTEPAGSVIELAGSTTKPAGSVAKLASSAPS